MKKEEFIQCIEITGGYLFEEEEGNYYISADKTIDFPDGSGKIYFDWEDVFAYPMKRCSIGEAIAELQEWRQHYRYVSSVRYYDSEGNLISE